MSKFLHLCLMVAGVSFPPAANAASNGSIVDEFLIWGNKNFSRLLARASNEEAVEFARVFSDTTTYLAKSNPKKCLRVVMPSVYGPLSREEWPTQFLDRQMTIQRRIAKTALASPNSIPTEAEAGPVFDRVYQDLARHYGAEQAKLLTRSDKNMPAKETCLAWGHLYQELSKLPPQQGGVVVRWLNAP